MTINKQRVYDIGKSIIKQVFRNKYKLVVIIERAIINIYFSFENIEKVYFVKCCFTSIDIHLNTYIYINTFVFAPISNWSFCDGEMNVKLSIQETDIIYQRPMVRKLLYFKGQKLVNYKPTFIVSSWYMFTYYCP